MSEKVAKNDAATRDVIRTETWRSEIHIFDSLGNPRIEADGQFVLTFNDTTGTVTGTHSHPSPHPVTVIIKPATGGNPAGIVILSADPIQSHIGARRMISGQDIYIGRRKPLMSRFDQEEGTWVGTKI